MSEQHIEHLKKERRLLVQRTADVHLARVGGEQTAHYEDGTTYSESVQAAGIYLPESEARRLAAAGSVMVVKDIHGQETIQEN
jgi:hypothetical protein